MIDNEARAIRIVEAKHLLGTERGKHESWIMKLVFAASNQPPRQGQLPSTGEPVRLGGKKHGKIGFARKGLC